MFSKRFKQAHEAGKYFNQANEYWRKAKQYVLKGKQKRADESLVEVIRCCQLAIECDERTGDAYILLSNGLINLAGQMTEQADSGQHEFMLSRAAAVIHLWHSLPYRNYPISKNAKIGEQLWRKIIQEIIQNQSMSESAALSLLDSYRDSLADESISPKSFKKIKRIIFEITSVQDSESHWLREPLEETLSPETLHFIIGTLPEVMQRRVAREQVREDRLFGREKLAYSNERLWDSMKYEGKITIANIEIMEQAQKAYHNNDFREAVGWMAWLFKLTELREKVMLDSDVKKEAIARFGKFFGGTLNALAYEAQQAENWHGLLMAIGLYEMVGVREKSDDLLQFLYDRIGKEGVERQLREIAQQPQMLIEDSIVNRIQRYLGQ